MRTLLLTTCLSVIAAPLAAQDVPPVAPVEGADYSPYPQQDFPNQVFFGDTHLHMSYSTDEGLNGDRLPPEDAYRFAKGETVVSSTGQNARLSRPLDVLVVADHAENLALPVAIEEANENLLTSDRGRQIYEIAAPNTFEARRDAQNFWAAMRQTAVDEFAGLTELSKSMWQRITTAADTHNAPGLFSAFIGFEYTLDPMGKNLHRVVVFHDNKERADQITPPSTYLAPDPKDVWHWMETYEEPTGGQILAIRHNGNLSNGPMFDGVGLTSGAPIDKSYAERRMRWEPRYEVTQMKGDAETHPFLSTDDEFADFETWDGGSFGLEPKTPEMLPNEYARSAYRRGLAFANEIGANPFKFGLIKTTDSHTSLRTVEENNFFGKFPALEPKADPIRFDEAATARLAENDAQKNFTRDTSAGGLAAVWARENTREALFDAMMRKEVYATTGTRLRVRVFAGYDFEAVDLPRSDFDRHGYGNGVPMGADLAADPEGRGPGFLVRAQRDPDGANLDRVQMVKGWLNADGTTSERVYDIACGGCDLLNTGCDGAVGSTVDIVDASYTNAIGQVILAGYWQDPDLDPAQSAFDHGRVLEIPTPRRTTYDAKLFGVELPTDVPASIQERAYTSPVWYTPETQYVDYP